MGGVPGPTPWAIWKKRIAIFLIGPMLVMSGAVIALGSHGPVTMTRISPSPQTIAPGAEAIHEWTISNGESGTPKTFDLSFAPTSDPHFTFRLTDASGTVVTQLGPISHGESRVFQLRVTADSDAAFTYSLDSTVTASATTGTPVFTDTVTTQVIEGGPVTLDKLSDAVASVVVGQQITYSIGFSNPYSTQTVTAFAVTDTLDSDVTAPSSITGGGIYDSSAHQIVWSFGDLSPSATGTVSYTATVELVPNQTQIVNTAVADGSNVASTSDSVILTVAAPVLVTFEKRVDDASPTPGGKIVYTINYEIRGDANLDNFRVTDTYDPLGIDVTGISPSPTSHDSIFGVIVWDLGTVSPVKAGSFFITATVVGSDGQTFVNTAEATGDQIPSASDSATFTVLAEADLSISKTDVADPVKAGESFAYSVTVTNTGPNPAEDVRVTDDLPAGLTFLGASRASCVATAQGFECDLGTLATSTTVNFQVTVTVDPGVASGTVLTNSVTVTSATLDPDQSSNVSTENTVVVKESNLIVSKTDGQGSVAAGTGPHTYTITIFNVGPSNAEVTVTDDWPSAFERTGLSCTPTAGTVTGTADFSCDLGTLGPGATFTVTATYLVPSDTTPGTYTNTATVTPVPSETDTTDNVASDSTTVTREFDLIVSKTDGPVAPVAGDGVEYQYNIMIFNAGPSDALNVRLTDDWPAGFFRTGVSCALSSGLAIGTGDFSCDLGTIAAGTTRTVAATYTVPATTVSGLQTNTVTATATGETNLPNNTAFDETFVSEQTDLVVTKDDGVTTLVAGDGSVQTFTITVFNAGPSDATEVTVSDVWPSGYLRLDASDTCSSPTGTGPFICSLGTIAAGTTATVTATYTVPSDTPAGDYTNTATAASSTETDPADNTSSDVNNVITRADLVVTKSDSPDPVAVLTVLTYTVTITNQGPSDANEVVVVDDIDDRTTYVTHTASDVCTIGSDNDVITCDLGVMPAGSSFSFQIRVSLGILPDRTVLSNTVTATSATTDPDPANNVFVQTTTVSAPVITLMKSASPPSGNDVGPGQRIDYTITYRNTGTLTGSNFVITDTVSAQFGLPTVRNGGTYNPETRTITWTIPSVAPGAVAEVGFFAQLGASDRRIFIDNIARATVREMAGVISSNQTRHTLVPPDVLITKSANLPEDSEVRALQVITYTLSVSNRGNVAAIGVSVTDDPPSGMSYVPGSTRLDGASVSDSGGTSALFGPGVSMGTLSRGQARSITFDMQVRGDVRPGQILENWGFVRWNFGLQVSGDFHHLRVLSRLSPPTLRMSILLQTAEGETLFVTVFNRVVGLLTVTGYEAALLLLLALGALGIGRNLTRDISPNLLRRMRE